MDAKNLWLSLLCVFCFSPVCGVLRLYRAFSVEGPERDLAVPGPGDPARP